MSKVKYYQGDILSPNRTGHECIVCIPTNCMGITCIDESSGHYLGKKMALGSVKYHAIRHNGFDFNIASMFLKHCSQHIDIGFNLDDISEAFRVVCLLAKPLPIRTLTTVRIPFKLAYKIDEREWFEILKIIYTELVEKDIPVEIWELKSLYN